MNKVLVITSGKGGVGKTTTTTALGAALALAGKKVAVVDFDVGLRNLDLVMGAERRVVFDLINVVQGVLGRLSGTDGSTRSTHGAQAESDIGHQNPAFAQRCPQGAGAG
jgi:cellulose biosynthesis protein BcsQ